MVLRKKISVWKKSKNSVQGSFVTINQFDFTGKNREIKLWDWFQSLFHEKFVKLFYSICFEFDFTKNIVKSSCRSYFKVDFTENSWDWVIQYATLMEELVKLHLSLLQIKGREREIQGFSVKFEFEPYINIRLCM